MSASAPVVTAWLDGCKGRTAWSWTDAQRRLYARSARAHGQVVAGDLANHKVLASLPGRGGPDAVAMSARRRLYVVGKAASG